MQKKTLVIFCLVICTGVLIFSGILLYNKEQERLLNNIKNSYSKYVVITKKSNLYKKVKDDYKKIGVIPKDKEFTLEKTKVNSTNDKYFKIKDTNYYIEYDKIKKSKEKIVDTDFILYNSNVITTSKFKLDDTIIINESISLPILIKDDKYTVKFNDRYYKLDKKYISKEVDTNNTNLEVSNKIVVLVYPDSTNIDETVKVINERHHNTISMSDYKLWVSNKVRLPKNSILLVMNYVNGIKELESKYNIELNGIVDDVKFNNSNKASVSGESFDNINSYLIDDFTKSNFDKVLNGEDVVKPVKKAVVNQSDSRYSTSVPVLNYHFFYDSSLGESCNERICLEASKLEEELKYLKDNDYKTLTMEEFRKWYDGEIEVPAKSVLLTIDDGAMGTSFINGNKLIPLLEKYDAHATLFLITVWWDINNYRSKNLDIQSHGYDIHKTGDCGTYNIKCLDHNGLYNDFKKSIDLVDNNTSFCFPFYVSTADSINVLKELGFKIAFVGGNRNATRSSNRYLIPRYPIYKDITMEKFINMIK